MAPQQSRKRKSEAMEEERDEPGTTTPTGSPAKKKMRITQSQKQALIDNLQLEITERARHLRAHYALQATDLRSRIERRINRIPISLRKAKIGDLLLRYTEEKMAKEMPQVPTSSRASSDARAAETSRPLHSLPRDLASPAAKHSSPVRPTSKKGPQQPSSEIDILSDKENGPAAMPDALSNPKNPKRAQPGTTTTTSRAASRRANANTSNVLSPKSHNSRNLPCSPIKDANPVPPQPYSPSKPTTTSHFSRPTSPLKPNTTSPFKSAANALHNLAQHAKRATTTAGSTSRTASKEKTTNSKTKMAMPPPPRPAPQQALQGPDRPSSQVSNHSSTSSTTATSSATTVVTKKPAAGGGKKITVKATTTRKATGPATTGTMSKAGAAGRGAVRKATNAGAAATGEAAGRAKRVLRKRN